MDDFQNDERFNAVRFFEYIFPFFFLFDKVRIYTSTIKCIDKKAYKCLNNSLLDFFS